ncbi:UNVERIFIED_CONTAM: hypothetical protein K2H54_051222 [Gekko kuhli]
MRSGSYIKAMGDDDSGDSDTSPKPSPKIAARRESYLKATQPSLTELTTLNPPFSLKADYTMSVIAVDMMSFKVSTDAFSINMASP